jgi:hypothetical protein
LLKLPAPKVSFNFSSNCAYLVVDVPTPALNSFVLSTASTFRRPCCSALYVDAVLTAVSVELGLNTRTTLGWNSRINSHNLTLQDGALLGGQGNG